MTRQVLAFDFGASSGRAMLGTYDGKTITQNEIHRFANEPVSAAGTLYWDVLRLFHEVKQGLVKASAASFESVGIDTWGVDFGLLDAAGNLMNNPVHYRDARNVGMSETCRQYIDDRAVYEITGIQAMDINTLYQLLYLVREQSETIERAQTLLMMPDLFTYFLTGTKQSEYTEASTSGLLDVTAKTWSDRLLAAVGIPKRLFTNIVQPGTKAGAIRKDICDELGIAPVPVISVAGHDTQSALAAVPAESDDFLFISCGTWALMGTHCAAADVSEAARSGGFSNEGGFGGISLLTNITGTWLIQECRRFWQLAGESVSYDELDAAAEASRPFACFIDPCSQEFTAPGRMPERIQSFCRKTGQYVPQTKGEIIRCIHESLAFTYRRVKEQIETLTGKTYPCVHMVGGGIKSAILCRMTADACGVPVLAGPVEGAVLGNIGIQMISMGILSDLGQFREIVQNMPGIVRYEHTQAGAYDKAFAQFKGVAAC